MVQFLNEKEILTMQNYVKYVCNHLLKMKLIPVKFISKKKMEEMAGTMTEACYIPQKNTIFMIKKSVYDMKDYCVLAHELRHAWQEKTNPEYYNNKDSGNLSEHEYNIQKGEIDANAFATIAIAIAFGKVTRRNYNKDKIAQAIYDERLEELKEEYEIEF